METEVVTREMYDKDIGEMRNMTTYISTELRMNKYYIMWVHLLGVFKQDQMSKDMR